MTLENPLTVVTGAQASDEGSTEVVGPESFAERLYGKTEPAEANTTIGQAKTDTLDAKLPAVAERYNLRLPEGTPIDGPLLDEFTALGKDLKWTNETAQKVADLHLKAIGHYARKAPDVDRMVQERAAEVRDWGTEVNHGPQAKETIQLARRVVNALGSPSEVQRLKDELYITGLGNHPVLVRGLARIARLLGDRLPADEQPKTIEQILYSNNS